eukprot:767461-Hanusia_phi.AAC.4
MIHCSPGMEVSHGMAAGSGASQRCFSSGIHFPHSKIPGMSNYCRFPCCLTRKVAAKSQAHRFTLTLFDKLWEQYRQRVSYVNVYENIVAQHGASFVNDHVAFRTIQTQAIRSFGFSPLAFILQSSLLIDLSQSPNMGIASIGRIFEALGYRAKECYQVLVCPVVSDLYCLASLVRRQTPECNLLPTS